MQTISMALSGNFSHIFIIHYRTFWSVTHATHAACLFDPVLFLPLMFLSLIHMHECVRGKVKITVIILSYTSFTSFTSVTIIHSFVIKWSSPAIEEKAGRRGGEGLWPICQPRGMFLATYLLNDSMSVWHLI